MGRSEDLRRLNRKRTEQTAQSFVAAFLLGTASGCATIQAPVYNARTARTSAVVWAQPADTTEFAARRYKYVQPRRHADYAGAFEVAAPKARPSQLKPDVEAVALPRPKPIAEPAVEAGGDDEPALDPRLEGARYYALTAPRPKPVLAGQGEAEAVALPKLPARFADATPRAKPGRDAPYDPAAAAKDETRARDAIDNERQRPKRDVAIADLNTEDDGTFQSTSDMGSLNGRFLWPVHGRVISDFGTRGSGLHNDGINIAAEPRTKVKAADSGTVIYAGSGLVGYGNLLLVRHSGGFVTAYAHNKTLLVERGAKVARGDTIALVGSTGDVTSPQLHFEIRKGDRAVDPNRYLVRETASR